MTRVYPPPPTGGPWWPGGVLIGVTVLAVAVCWQPRAWLLQALVLPGLALLVSTGLVHGWRAVVAR